MHLISMIFFASVLIFLSISSIAPQELTAQANDYVDTAVLPEGPLDMETVDQSDEESPHQNESSPSAFGYESTTDAAKGGLLVMSSAGKSQRPGNSFIPKAICVGLVILALTAGLVYIFGPGDRCADHSADAVAIMSTGKLQGQTQVVEERSTSNQSLEQLVQSGSSSTSLLSMPSTNSISAVESQIK